MSDEEKKTPPKIFVPEAMVNSIRALGNQAEDCSKKIKTLIAEIEHETNKKAIIDLQIKTRLADKIPQLKGKFLTVDKETNEINVLPVREIISGQHPFLGNFFLFGGREGSGIE